jgi:Holliday junction resolvase
MMYGKEYEREFVRLMNRMGLDCHRIAGSGAASEAVCDCILFYNKKTYLVEVKATKEKKLYLRGRIKDQLQKMNLVAKRNEVIPILAIKFKRRGWNLVKVKDSIPIPFNKEVIINENCRQNLHIA